jgi:hypothetical protein
LALPLTGKRLFVDCGGSTQGRGIRARGIDAH